MAIGRISTYAIFQNTLRNLSDRQLDLFNTQNQISSGRKTESFEGIALQSEQFLNLEAKISKADLYVQDNKLAETRLEVTSGALDQVVQIATSIKNLIQSRRNGVQGTANTFNQQIRNEWRALVGALNVSSEGRFLFSGTATDVPPVNATTFPLLQNPEVPDDGYYNGNAQDISLRVDDNIQFNYNVRADASGIQKIFAGLSEANRGDTQGGDATLARAYDYISQGIEEVITLQAGVNANKIAVQNANQEHASLKLYWQGVKDEIINTDLVAASTQVAINQGILQASFQAFARINSLQLSDFLR